MANNDPFKPSKLDSLIHGLNRKPLIFGGLDEAATPLILIGLAFFAFGLLTGTGATITAFAPELAIRIPICRGSAATGYSTSLVCLVIGSLFIFMGRTGTSRTIASSEGLMLEYRNRRSCFVPWYLFEAQFYVLGRTAVKLASGHWRLIARPTSYTAWKFDLLLDFVALAKPFISEQRPNISDAHKGLIDAFMGPGISFPLDDVYVRENIARRMSIYVTGLVGSLVLAFLGWMTWSGPAIGVAGILLAPVADWATLKGPRRADTVLVFRNRIEVMVAGTGCQVIPFSEIVGLTTSYEFFRIRLKETKERIDIMMDDRSIKLLIETIRIAAAIKPLQLAVDRGATA